MKLPKFIADRWPSLRGTKAITDAGPIVRSQIDFGEMFRSRYDRPRWYDECYGAYENLAAVYLLCHIPAATLAQVPLRVYRRREGGGRLLKGHERKALAGRVSTKTALEMGSDDVEEITDPNDPYVSVLRQWSLRHDGFSGLYGLVTHIRIAGGSYIAPIKTGDTIDRLEVLDPRHVRPNVAQDGEELVDSYTGIRDGRDHWTHDASDVVPIGFEHPNHPDRWHGWLHSSMDEAGMLYDMVKSRRALFQNGGRPGPVIKGAKTQAQIESIHAQWMQRYADARKAHVPLVLLDGMDAVTDKNAVDLDFVNGYQQTLETLAAAGGVPMTLIQQQDANLAGAVNAAPVFAEITLAPIARLIEDKFNERISPYFGDGVFVAFDDLIGQDEEREARIAQMLVGGPTMTPNEYRAERGQPPIEGGDALILPLAPETSPFGPSPFDERPTRELPEDDTIEVEAKPSAPIQEQALNGAQVSALQEMAQSVASGLLPADAAVEMMLASFPGVPEDRLRRIIEAMDGFTPRPQPGEEPAPELPEADTDGQNRITGDTKTITYADAVYLATPLDGCNCECSAPPKGRKDIDDQPGYEAAARELSKDTAEWYVRTYTDAVELVNDNPGLSQAAALAFIESAADELFEVQAGKLEEMFAAGYEREKQALPPSEVDVTIQQERDASAFAAYRTHRIGVAQGIGETALQDAQRTIDKLIESGLAQGERQDEIADLLSSKVPGLARSRAETIARTEVANALGMARIEAYRQSDVVEGKQYLLSSDPCPICVAVARMNQGKTLDIDEPFLKASDSIPLPGGGVYSPGRDIISPPTHPRCRCDHAPVLEDFGE